MVGLVRRRSAHEKRSASIWLGGERRTRSCREAQGALNKPSTDSAICRSAIAANLEFRTLGLAAAIPLERTARFGYVIRFSFACEILETKDSCESISNINNHSIRFATLRRDNHLGLSFVLVATFGLVLATVRVFQKSGWFAVGTAASFSVPYL